MKKIILVVSLVLVLSGCALDQQVQEQSYIDSHTWVKSPKWEDIEKEDIYILINNDGSYTYVTIDGNNDVWDLDGNWLFNLDD